MIARRFVTVHVALCVLHFAIPASAQQRRAPPPGPIERTPIDPIAVELLRTKPTTPSNMLRVVNSLIELREPTAAAPLVQQLNEMPLDDAALDGLYQEFGSAVFMRIGSQPVLQPVAKQFADKVLTAANRHARDPQRIAELIEQLKSDSLPRRAEAIGQLRLGGEVAMKALLEALADPGRTAEHAAIEDAIVAFDSAALPSLASIIQNRQSPLAVAAASMLGRLHNPDSELYLFAPAFAPGYPAPVQQVAQQALAHRSDGRPVDASRAAGRLYFRAAQLYDRPNRTADELRLAAALAHGAALILPNNRDIRRLQLSTALEGTDPAGHADLLKQVTVGDVDDLLLDALARDRWYVAVAACNYLRAVVTTDALRASAPQLSPLVLAARSPDRRVRMAAVQAIGQLGPQGPYPGATDVLTAIEFFVRSTGTRRAIVADVREQHARNVAGLLATQGLEAEIATDDRTLFELATTMPDCELILVHMTIVEPSAGAILARLRHDVRTARVPIGILATSDKLDRAEAIARRHDRTLAFVDAPVEAAAARAVAATETVSGGEQLTATERLSQARYALDWLAAADGPAISIDQWRSLEDAIAAGIYVPALGQQAVALLPHAGTASSQRLLIEVASNSVQPLVVRQNAVAALGESIVRFGTLLTGDEIRGQYNRYNASQRSDKQEQQLLAAILDQIELRAASDVPAASARSAPR